MTDAPDMALLMQATLCGACVVLTGAFYAALFAFAHIRRSAAIGLLAGFVYLLLIAATAGLANALRLSGWWQVVVATMLLGYLVGPWAIWHLCRGTHGIEDAHSCAIRPSTQEALS